MNGLGYLLCKVVQVFLLEPLISWFDLHQKIREGSLLDLEYLVVLAGPPDREDPFLDLLREADDAFDLHHVVDTTHQTGVPREGPSALTGFLHNIGEVLGPEPDGRESVVGQGSDDQFTLLSGGHRVEVLIHHLHKEMIGVDVKTGPALTVIGETGTTDLCQAICLPRPEVVTPLLLELAPDLLAPCLGSEESDLEIEIPFWIESHLPGRLCEIQPIARGRADGRGSKIPCKVDLPPGVPGTRGKVQRTYLVCSVSESEPSGEKSKAIGILDDVSGTDSTCPHPTCHDLSPVVEVLFCVDVDHRLARSSRGTMQFHPVLPACYDETEWIPEPQFVLAEHWEFLDILQGPDA